MKDLFKAIVLELETACFETLCERLPARLKRRKKKNVESFPMSKLEFWLNDSFSKKKCGQSWALAIIFNFDMIKNMSFFAFSIK